MKLLSRLAGSLLISALSIASTGAEARADESLGPFRISTLSFGDVGQWVYSITTPDEFPFSFTKTDGGDWVWAVRPAADTFIAPDVSVGGIVSLSGGASGRIIGVGARAGYNAAFSKLVSAWIRGGLFYSHYSMDGGPSGSDTFVEVKVPFLFHVIPHILVGVGPTIEIPIQRSNGQPKDPTYGLAALVGGYI